MKNISAESLTALSAELHQDAASATGLTDFGAEDYLEGMEQVLAGAAKVTRDEASLKASASHLTQAALVMRLRTEAALSAHPEYRETKLRAPVVIAGLPRSGTTALHLLLSKDDQFQVLERWLTLFPQPRPPRGTWETNPDYAAAIVVTNGASAAKRRMHFVLPDQADECILPMAQTFVSNAFGCRLDMPTYDDWFLAQDMTPSLSRHADLLRLISSTGPEKTWLLKNPSHIMSLHELFNMFPGARVIYTHRHPFDAIGSLVSMLTTAYPAGGVRDAHQVARREIRVWAEAMRRAAKARAAHPDAFVDVQYDDFLNRPMDCLTNIYDTFGLIMTCHVRDLMEAWIREHPPKVRGRDAYDPNQLGVTREVISAEYADYMAMNRYE